MYFSCTFATVKTKGVGKRFESSFTYTIYIREIYEKSQPHKGWLFWFIQKTGLIDSFVFINI